MKRRVALILLMAAALPVWAADLTGTWSADVVLDAGSGTATFVFKQDGEKLSGSYSGTLGQATLSGTVKGDKAEWSFDVDQVGKVTYAATMDGATKMKGSTVYGLLGKGTFTAQKK
jgi:hypothetical protein